MEHCRSTIAVTVCAVFGLATATYVLHLQNDTAPEPLARSATTVPVSTVAWRDPPARSGVPESTGTIRPNSRLAEAGIAVAAIAQPAALVSNAPVSNATPAMPAVRAEPARRALAAHRTRVAERSLRRAAHLRHTALVRPAEADRSPPPPVQPAPVASTRIDPIGDIIRGLGFGRDS